MCGCVGVVVGVCAGVWLWVSAWCVGAWARECGGEGVWVFVFFSKHFPFSFSFSFLFFSKRCCSNDRMGVLQGHGSHTPLQDEVETPMMDLVKGAADPI